MGPILESMPRALSFLVRVGPPQASFEGATAPATSGASTNVGDANGNNSSGGLPTDFIISEGLTWGQEFRV